MGLTGSRQAQTSAAGATAPSGLARAGWTLVLWLAGSLVARADVLQWRPAISARVYHAGRFEAIAYQESWISDVGPNPAYLQFSPRFRYHVLDYLTLGLNYSFIESQVPLRDGDSEWVDQQRIEWEVNPHWESKSGLKLLLRNRLEVRWIEHLPTENWRSRHLAEVGYPIHFPKPVQGMFSSAEFFYDWSRMRVSETRLSPLGFDFGLAPGVSLRVYYTWRQVERPHDWASSQLFWTVLNLKL